MERRNFLGIAALLGLSPMLPRNVFTEEQGAPGIVKAQLADGTEFEFGEPVVYPDDEFKVLVTGNVTVESEDERIKMGGLGELDGKEIKWETESFRPPCTPIIQINGKSAELISIYQDSCAPELYIDEAPGQILAPWPPVQTKTFLVCKKI